MKKPCDTCVCREACDTPPLTVKAHCTLLREWFGKQKPPKTNPDRFKKFRDSIKIKTDICD